MRIGVLRAVLSAVKTNIAFGGDFGEDAATLARAAQSSGGGRTRILL